MGEDSSSDEALLNLTRLGEAAGLAQPRRGTEFYYTAAVQYVFRPASALRDAYAARVKGLGFALQDAVGVHMRQSPLAS